MTTRIPRSSDDPIIFAFSFSVIVAIALLRLKRPFWNTASANIESSGQIIRKTSAVINKKAIVFFPFIYPLPLIIFRRVR